MLSVIKSNMNEMFNTSEEEISLFIHKYENHVDLKWVDLDGIVKDVCGKIPDKITINDFYNYK